MLTMARVVIYDVDEQSPKECVVVTSIESVVERYGNGIGADDFAEQLDRLMRRRSAADPRSLSSHDRDVLTSVGVPAADLDLPGPGLLSEAAELLEANAAAMPAADAADLLGRSVGRVRGAIADGSLYGVKVGRHWLLPRWQFEGSGLLPHLRKVVAAVPAGTSAVTIERVMTQATEELYVDGRPASPRDWLLAGNPPAPVSDLIAQLYAW